MPTGPAAWPSSVTLKHLVAERYMKSYGRTPGIGTFAAGIGQSRDFAIAGRVLQNKGGISATTILDCSRVPGRCGATQGRLFPGVRCCQPHFATLRSRVPVSVEALIVHYECVRKNKKITHVFWQGHFMRKIKALSRCQSVQFNSSTVLMSCAQNTISSKKCQLWECAARLSDLQGVHQGCLGGTTLPGSEERRTRGKHLPRALGHATAGEPLPVHSWGLS